MPAGAGMISNDLLTLRKLSMKENKANIRRLQNEMKHRIRPIAYEYMTAGLTLNHIRQVFRNLIVVMQETDTRLIIGTHRGTMGA